MRDREYESSFLIASDRPEVAMRRLRNIEKLGGYPLRPEKPQAISDVYWDTTTGDLQAGRIALRIRHLAVAKPEHWIALKHDVEDGRGEGERVEIERGWSVEAFAEIRRALRKLGVHLPECSATAPTHDPAAYLTRCGLHPIQSRHTRRTVRAILPKSPRARRPLAEMAIDTVTYTFPACRRVRHYEVEIEAKNHRGVEALADLDRALRRLPGLKLERWPFSKLATGEAILKLAAAPKAPGRWASVRRLDATEYRRLATRLRRQGR